MEKIEIGDTFQELPSSHTSEMPQSARSRLPTMSRGSLPPGMLGNLSTVSLESSPYHDTPEHEHFHVYSYNSLGVFDYFTFSILNKIFVPVVLHVLWAVFWVILYNYAEVKVVGVVSGLVTVVSVVISLLLVFRTNTAYDRYWEARKLWGTVISHVRNLSRFIHVLTKQPNLTVTQDKKGAINLLLAFCVATKHDLRGERGINFHDLRGLLAHIPEYKPGVPHPRSTHLPLDISFHLSAYFRRCVDAGLIDSSTYTNCVLALSGMVDCLSNFERIRDCPIPLAYAIHLKQIIEMYLLFLPFQLLSTMGWATVIVQFIAAFAFLGIDAIGIAIENPFGYDPNDLPMDSFCEQIKLELEQIMEYPTNLIESRWTKPLEMGLQTLKKHGTKHK